MSVKSIVLLLMLLITVSQVTACDEESHVHMCNLSRRPMNCTNNSRIRVYKSSEMYQLILCANDQCSENITISFECCDICEASRMLATNGGTSCNSHNNNYYQRCECRMDDIFDNYCLSATSTTNPAELAPTTTSYSITWTPTLTSPFLTQAFEPVMPVDLSACENGSRASASESDSVNSTTLGPIIALGVLLCLSVLLLAMVTIGWVYTCLVMKKRDTEKSTAALKSTNEEEIYLKNPAYEGTASSTSAPAVATYDVIANSPSQARTGQPYDILNRGQATGQTTAMAAQRTTGDGNYSQLGPRDCERVNEQ